MKSIVHKLLLASMFAILMFGSSGCNDDYYSDYFYDSNLIGEWTLTGVNNVPVYGTQSNSLYFSPGGRGSYYYYSNGVEQKMGITWSCQLSNGGNAYLNINYMATANYTTSRYWFRSNDLYMMFYTNAGAQIVYRYTYTGR